MNAIQAIGQGGLIIISIAHLKGTKKLQVRIIDNGTGITKENLQKIFDPFFTTKEQGMGTGLGLSIVYNIIKEHKGNISIDSELEKGTTVTMEFPFN